MKKFVLWIIKGYKSIPFNSHKMCRFTPTCSTYMEQAINRFGLIKGMNLGIKRIIRCNPFGKYGYDPVPMKEEK